MKLGFLTNNKGFNLTELMVASAISGFVALGASSLYVFIMDNFRIMVDQNSAQESLLWTAYQSKGWLQQAKSMNGAVNVQMSNGIPERGTQVFFDFQRETSTGGNGVEAHSQISVTNVHNTIDLNDIAAEDGPLFGIAGDQNPYLDRGVLGKVVHFRSRAGAALVNQANWGNSVWYDRLSGFDITDVSPAGLNPDTITIQITTRYIINTSTNNILNFCKPAGACPGTNMSFSELSLDVVVGLRNLNFNAAGNPGGLHGNLYYYRFMAPPMLTGLDYTN